MTTPPGWALIESESILYAASEAAREAGRWDVVAKIEDAALSVRQAATLNDAANARDLARAVDAVVEVNA